MPESLAVPLSTFCPVVSVRHDGSSGDGGSGGGDEAGEQCEPSQTWTGEVGLVTRSCLSVTQSF